MPNPPSASPNPCRFAANSASSGSRDQWRMALRAAASVVGVSTANRLSGKKSACSRDFLVTFWVLECRLRALGIGLEAANHHLDGTDLNTGFTMSSLVLVISAQPATASQPSDSTLHHPADLQGDELLLVGRFAADLQAVADLLLRHPGVQGVVVVLVVCEHRRQ